MSTAARPTVLLVLAHALGVLTTGSIVATAIEGIATGEPVLDAIPFLVLLAVTLGVGWLLTVRLPGHPVGWIILAIPALFTVTAPLNLLEIAVRGAAPGLANWIEWYTGTDADPSWAWIPPVWLLLAQLPLRFPNGRLPSPRWRWFSWFTVAALVILIGFMGTGESHIDTGAPNPAHVQAVSDIAFLLPVAFALLGVSFVGAVGSVFVRYRHGTATERAQLRWMLWAVALAAAGLVLGWITPAGFWLNDWDLLLYALVPVAVAIAVLRYRLYEIDRIVSRTATYAIVTLVAIGTYALVVLLISLLIPGNPGRTPPIVVALATLAAAGVFLPALRWIRRLIDRVFNRSQYDAERVVVAFGERIRNGADPHTAGVDLVGAVGQTLQPSAIGLWVRS